MSRPIFIVLVYKVVVGLVYMWVVSKKASKMVMEISRELKILPVDGIKILLSLLRYRTRCRNK